MSGTHVRWLKFSFVGALGIAVQLGALAILTRLHVHYLLATGLAVECAVLHNFVWHERFTWSDRTHIGGFDSAQGGLPRADVGHPRRFYQVLVRLARFHAANAAISMGGNLLLMRLLVGHAGFPAIPANLMSIAVTYLANFLVSDRWVFRAANGNQDGARSPISNRVRWEKGT